MENPVRSPEAYRELFDTDGKRKEALTHALDIRKFEIELYWKRTAYFWTLIGAAFAGYVTLASSIPRHPNLIFLIGCIGTVLSVGWYLANRGSKYWQENWERHVDALEDDIIGPLYRTTTSRKRYRFLNPFSGYNYSVSRINQVISLFIALLWVGITITSFPLPELRQISDEYGLFALSALTVATTLTLLFQVGRNSNRYIDFNLSDLKSDRENKP